MEQSTLDIMWILICASLVWCMQAGFLCLETGMTRSKNNINVALKNIVDNSTSIFIFWLFGFSIAYGSPMTDLFSAENNYYLFSSEELSVNAFFVFQLVFCSTCCTILSGAAAERLKFIMYPVIVLLIAGLIYPFVVHHVWSGVKFGIEQGLLAASGFYDFAGACVVHTTGGWVALAVVIIIGPRLGRFDKNGKPRTIYGSNLALSALGVLILWFGWIGFNGGSTLRFDGSIGIVLRNTFVSGAAGLVLTLIITRVVYRTPSAEDLINGALAGLVAITGAADVVNSAWQAALIGAIGGLVVLLATRLLLRLRIDDVVGAIPVHLAGGIWGTIAVGLFADLSLLDTGLNRIEQITMQLIGALCIGLWAFGITFIVIGLMNKITPIRISKEAEYVGLNISEHNAVSELFELITFMKQQYQTGSLEPNAPVDMFTEVGIIGEAYNQVLEKLQDKENKLQDSYVKLEALNTELKAYDHTLAHDMKNPVSLIHSYSTQLSEEYTLDDDVMDYIGRIKGASEDALGLINELLYFAKIGGAITGKEPVDIEKILLKIAAVLENSLAKKSGRIICDLRIQHVYINPTALTVIFRNLISNAIKYAAAERRLQIIISSYITNNKLCIEVRDNGIGMQDTDKEKIFIKHHRLQNDRLTEEGHGIGLYNVKRLVEASDGAINVTSTLDEQSCFYLTFAVRNNE